MDRKRLEKKVSALRVVCRINRQNYELASVKYKELENQLSVLKVDIESTSKKLDEEERFLQKNMLEFGTPNQDMTSASYGYLNYLASLLDEKINSCTFTSKLENSAKADFLEQLARSDLLQEKLALEMSNLKKMVENNKWI